MSDKSIQTKAVKELQNLGLREYEAKCLVALTEMSLGTARDVSDWIDVPRTRVYEAVRVLESKGLVEIQHASPQQFRAIPVDEAITLLERRYQSRIESVGQYLGELRHSERRDEQFGEQEVWALSDDEGIATRTETMLEGAEQDVLSLVGDSRALSEDLLGSLQTLADRSVDLVVGAPDDAVQTRLTGAVPENVVCQSKLQWLHGDDTYNTIVGRLLLVDGRTALVSTIIDQHDGGEQAVYGDGPGNSLVVITRRLLSAGLDTS